MPGAQLPKFLTVSFLRPFECVFCQTEFVRRVGDDSPSADVEFDSILFSFSFSFFWLLIPLAFKSNSFIKMHRSAARDIMLSLRSGLGEMSQGCGYVCQVAFFDFAALLAKFSTCSYKLLLSLLVVFCSGKLPSTDALCEVCHDNCGCFFSVLFQCNFKPSNLRRSLFIVS